MEKPVRVFALLTVTALTGAIVLACSDDDKSTVVIEAGVEASVQDAAPVDAGLTDEQCSQESERASCESCCGTVHAQGFESESIGILSCACGGFGITAADGGDAGEDAGGAGGPCLDECKTTLCKAQPENPNNACLECINREALAPGGVCYAAVVKACGSDPDCVALQDCLEPCTKK